MAGDPILYMSSASLKLKLVSGGTDAEYNGQVSDAQVVPEAGDEQAITTLDGVRHVRVTRSSFTLKLTGAQDWRDPEGLARFLWTNAGAEATFTLQAHGSGVVAGADTPSMTGNVVLAESAYGGEADTWTVLEVELACTARPTLKVA